MMINCIMCTSKILIDLCFTKQKLQTKNTFVRIVYCVLVVKIVLTEHKEDFLSINGLQSVKLEKGTIEFKNFFKQIPPPFKIYADFESNLKVIQIYEGFYTKKYLGHIPCSFACKRVCIDDRFTETIVAFRNKNAAYEFIKAIFKEYECCKN